ncbi:hypothetical protein EJ06DRAFT_529691 [Trichodelitschia bisporula]|uniref:Uncharacterized protein n=1 Tax=Trichodelitschia bisporula TaxID=703511 RepID=A0A6G1HXV3_9PEZI|nr:hypothetical protein EJ06DRAFT_529691 [Trichodelitschia bisporula]
MWLLECTLSALGLLNQLSLRPQVYKYYATVKWPMVALDTIIKYLMSSKERQACLTQSHPTPKAVDSDELRAERLKEQEEILDYLWTRG